MMSSSPSFWPSSEDYNTAVQTPALCFSDQDLASAEPVCNAMGLPAPRSGSFADVYQLRGSRGQAWAVKCFTRPIPGLAARYTAVHRHLAQLNLPFAVDFRFLDQGVRIGERWFPAVKMDWVDGHLLNAFTRDVLTAPARLDKLLRIWAKVVRRLEGGAIIHGDLQHGNVLVVRTDEGRGAVTLVDYDGMGVPELRGTSPGEAGHPAYQHPDRVRYGAFGPGVDRFSALVVATALRCLRVGGTQLWDRFDNDMNLLFVQSDFERPDGSAAFAELRAIDDPLARHLIKALETASRGHLANLPPLQTVLESAPVTVALSSSGEEDTRQPTTWVDGKMVSPASFLDPIAESRAGSSARVEKRLPDDTATESVWEAEDSINEPPRRSDKRPSRKNGWGATAFIAPIIAGMGFLVVAILLGSTLWRSPSVSTEKWNKTPSTHKEPPIPLPPIRPNLEEKTPEPITPVPVQTPRRPDPTPPPNGFVAPRPPIIPPPPPPPPQTNWVEKTYSAEEISKGLVKLPDLSKWELRSPITFDPKMVPSLGPAYKFDNGKLIIHQVGPMKNPSFSIGEGGTGFACQIKGWSDGDRAARWGLVMTNRDPTGNRGVQVLFGQDGKVGIDWVQDADRPRVILLLPTWHSASKPGTGANNVLTVIVRGRILEVYVNGVAVTNPIHNPIWVNAGFSTQLFVQCNGGGLKGRAVFESARVWSLRDQMTPFQQKQ